MPTDTPTLWVWYYDSRSSGDTATVYFRKEFSPTGGRLAVAMTADNSFTAYLDGVTIATGGDWTWPAVTTLQVTPNVPHVLAFQVSNAGGPGGLVVDVRESARPCWTPLRAVALFVVLNLVWSLGGCVRSRGLRDHGADTSSRSVALTWKSAHYWMLQRRCRDGDATAHWEDRDNQCEYRCVNRKIVSSSSSGSFDCVQPAMPEMAIERLWELQYLCEQSLDGGVYEWRIAGCEYRCVGGLTSVIGVDGGVGCIFDRIETPVFVGGGDAGGA